MLRVKPRSVRFAFSRHTGTFSNINSFLYFAVQKDGALTILMRDNNVLGAVHERSRGPLVYENSRPFCCEKEQIYRSVGMGVKLGEHQRPATYSHCARTESRRRELKRTFHDNFYFKSGPVSKSASLREVITGTPTVGAHVRFLRHFAKPLSFREYLESYWSVVDARLSNECDQVFLATHLRDVHTEFKKRYGNRLVWYEQYLNPNGQSDWHGNKRLDTEREEVVIDMFLLACCKTVVGGPSNVFYAALWWNPDLEYSILPILEGVGSR